MLFWLVTAILFALPFYCFAVFTPWYLYLVIAPFLLKCCFAWRSLEEHTLAVVAALKDGVQNGREQVKMLVSRDTANLEREHILSAGYESMTENLTDSIISPLFYFSLFGLVGAAIFRAANTMDAMLGYRDERDTVRLVLGTHGRYTEFRSRPAHGIAASCVLCLHGEIFGCSACDASRRT